jgi:hypothetical protein
MQLSKSKISVPAWQLIINVSQLCTGWLIEVFDKTLDTEIDFLLDSTGNLSVEEAVYLRPVRTIKELDEAISDYSDQIRGYSETFKEKEQCL